MCLQAASFILFAYVACTITAINIYPKLDGTSLSENSPQNITYMADIGRCQIARVQTFENANNDIIGYRMYSSSDVRCAEAYLTAYGGDLDDTNGEIWYRTLAAPDCKLDLIRDLVRGQVPGAESNDFQPLTAFILTFDKRTPTGGGGDITVQSIVVSDNAGMAYTLFLYQDLSLSASAYIYDPSDSSLDVPGADDLECKSNVGVSGLYIWNMNSGNGPDTTQLPDTPTDLSCADTPPPTNCTAVAGNTCTATVRLP